MVFWCRLLGNGSCVQTDQPGMPQVGTQGLAECKSEIESVFGGGRLDCFHKDPAVISCLISLWF